MHTLGGFRFVPIARVAGTLVGLDARWLGLRGLLMVVLIVLCTPAGPLSPDTHIPLWARLAFGLASVASLAITSLAHELGHVVAGRMAGLTVRAVIVGPEGSATIRTASDHPRVNFCTALAGPLANAVLGTGCAALCSSGALGSLGSALLPQLAALQLLTGMVNLLPFGRLDGASILAAWRAFAPEARPLAPAAATLSPAATVLLSPVRG